MIDLVEDLGETNHLAEKPHGPAKQLFAALARWRDDVADGAPPQ